MSHAMRARTCSVFGLFLIAAVAYGQSPPPDLQEAVEAFGAARNAGDEQGWGRYTTDDFMVVNTAGSVLTKADRMAAIKGNKVTTAPPQSDHKWRIYGDTAIDTFVVNIDAGSARVTFVWVKQGAGWKVATIHETMISKP